MPPPSPPPTLQGLADAAIDEVLSDPLRDFEDLDVQHLKTWTLHMLALLAGLLLGVLCIWVSKKAGGLLLACKRADEVRASLLGKETPRSDGEPWTMSQYAGPELQFAQISRVSVGVGGGGSGGKRQPRSKGHKKPQPPQPAKSGGKLLLWLEQRGLGGAEPKLKMHGIERLDDLLDLLNRDDLQALDLDDEDVDVDRLAREIKREREIKRDLEEQRKSETWQSALLAQPFPESPPHPRRVSLDLGQAVSSGEELGARSPTARSPRPGALGYAWK